MAEAKGKKSMIIYHDWLELFEDFTEEEVGQLMLALLRFDIGGEDTKFTDKALRITYKQLKATIKRDREAYEEKCKKRTESIKNYWAGQKKANEYKSIQMNSNEYKSIQMRTDNDSDIDNDNDNDSGSDSDTDAPHIGAVRDYFTHNNYNSDPEDFFHYNAARKWAKLKEGYTWQKLAQQWERQEKKANNEPEEEGGRIGEYRVSRRLAK